MDKNTLRIGNELVKGIESLEDMLHFIQIDDGGVCFRNPESGGEGLDLFWKHFAFWFRKLLTDEKYKELTKKIANLLISYINEELHKRKKEFNRL